MKGVILAGGTGSRLQPLTAVTNKHLLPVYDKPVIFYPIERLKEAGVKDILIITSHEYTNHFVRLLGGGKELGVNLSYAVQLQPKGIADALRLAENFAGRQKIAVILGDNIFEDSLKPFVNKFKKMKGAAIVVKKRADQKGLGVVEIKNGKVVGIEEKPEHPKSDMCATGLYFYDSDVFDIIRKLKPSKRGEYEITDVNRTYLKRGMLNYFEVTGEWFDCGDYFWLLKAGLFVAKKLHGFKN